MGVEKCDIILLFVTVKSGFFCRVGIVAVADLFAAFKGVKLLKLFARAYETLTDSRLLDSEYLCDLGARKTANHR